MFLLSGRSHVLVDTGVPGSARRIERWLHHLGLRSGDLSLIVLTHAHRDHLGSAAALRASLHTPIGLPSGGLHAARRGHDRYGEPSGMFARHVVARFPKAFEPLEPDVLLHHGDRLDVHGVAATVLHTPGHTDHCISFVTDDGHAVIGDLFVGSHVFTNRPGVPYWVESAEAWRESRHRIQKIPLRTLHPGHGKSFTTATLASMHDLR